MTNRNHRKPDWNTWGLMPKVSLMEAVILSCDIDPDTLKGSGLTGHIFHDWKTSPEIARRLKVATAHIGKDGALKSDRNLGDANYPYYQWVRLSDFAAWADLMRFELPKQFPREEVAQAKDVALASATRWPWGEYETKLLIDLAAAAEHWWVRYDPTDNTTAPTNEKVSEWLEKRGVSKRTAEVMATILRPEGLSTGPRS